MALNTWMGYDPFFDIRNIHGQVDDVFNEFFHDKQLQKEGKGKQKKGSVWLPVVDVKENDQGFAIHAELPGLKKEDIHIDVNDGILTLSGEKKDEKKEENERYHRYCFPFRLLFSIAFYLFLPLSHANFSCRVERSYGKFVRSFALPKGADPMQITAEFNDGVLELKVPKPPTKEPVKTKIQIQ
eukprot:Phypoly_transcript_19708.p1 GENE.Phypoly_transcript_19708~~Phypoly_transcript_19708.p1  ORF type:complete len:208 (-),score=46.24 Phypoly_transcript_19708:88-639(-)